MKKKNEQSRDLNKIKHTNTYTTGVPKVVEGKEWGKETEKERDSKRQKQVWRINGRKLPKFEEKHLSTHQKLSKFQTGLESRVPYLDA